MIKYLTFENVMAIIKLFSVGAGIIIIIKQRTEVIVSKYKQKRAETERDEWKKVATETKEIMQFIADTQLSIVQASKMTVEDKTLVTRKYIDAFEVEKPIEETVEKIDINEEIIKPVFEVFKEVGKTTGLLDD